MKRILVTGSNGQLGKTIQNLAPEYRELDFYFTDKATLDITQSEEVSRMFQELKPDYCINCAAYTQVDQAERTPEPAFAVNVLGVENLVNACVPHNTTLIQISTDYVFDGKKNEAYSPQDETNPINVYGKTKLQGEDFIQKHIIQHFIIRTSWLYSEYGSNFYKTIRRLIAENKTLNITGAETGSPTHAMDLAHFILGILRSKHSAPYGIYHFCNTGSVSRYDFALEIVRISHKVALDKLHKNNNYITFTPRPQYSVLDTSLTRKHFDVEIPEWKDSLENIKTGAFLKANKDRKTQ